MGGVENLIFPFNHAKAWFDVHFFSVPPGQKQLSAYGYLSPLEKVEDPP